ncbi:LuxR C-terminal-related transcriptional regulator [Actinoplanes sp. CA-030573]|uniref:LuxR C-terminal-related transcriptional regulator n=1 Tax=Actinoplanes sp. CA-030573 TaxID=3239898 RepID=UPI003D931113
MAEPLGVALDLAAEIHRVTPGGDPAQDLAFMWDPMRRLVPFVARWIGTIDEDHRRYTTVASAGHDADGTSYMESEDLTELRKTTGLVGRRRPLRMQDAPPHWAQLPCWSEHWWPAGFREAVVAPIATRDGRHLGVLTLHTDSAGRPTAMGRDAVAVITHAIAAVLDPMNSLTGLARLVQGATAAVTVDRRGMLAPLPGMPRDPLLTGTPDVVTTAIDDLDDQVRHTSFLSPVPADGGQQRYVRITGLACPAGTPDDLVGLVVTSPPGDLRGLTLRELVVLGLVIEGYANQGIASRLSITARTAAAHLEHIRAKLGAPTRTAAAVLAMRGGLYIPYRLAETW